MITRISVCSHVRSMFDPDGALLLDLNEGKYFSLNSIGMEIWQKLESGATPSEILAHLKSTFYAPASRLQDDLGVFLQSLADKGLVDVNA